MPCYARGRVGSDCTGRWKEAVGTGGRVHGVTGWSHNRHIYTLTSTSYKKDCKKGVLLGTYI